MLRCEALSQTLFLYKALMEGYYYVQLYTLRFSLNGFIKENLSFDCASRRYLRLDSVSEMKLFQSYYLRCTSARLSKLYH